MVRNICWKCKHWEECFKYRYGNKKQEYMEKTTVEEDMWGHSVIYVGKCKNYTYEEQNPPLSPIDYLIM